MSSSETQSYGNHRRFAPLYHFVAFPIFLVNLIVAGLHWYREPSGASAWLFVVAFGMLAMLGNSRLQAIMVQDRIIRLEEKLRLQAIAPDLVSQFDRLSRRQVAALRFASDAELALLTRRVLAGEFATNGDIKKAIEEWKADVRRV